MEKEQEDRQAAMDREDRRSELREMPERKHIDVLLDISEESLVRDLEPHEWHCYSGWEHAVSDLLSALLT